MNGSIAAQIVHAAARAISTLALFAASVSHSRAATISCEEFEPGDPGNVVVEIVTAAGVVLGRSTIPNHLMTSWGWKMATFGNSLNLTPPTKYRIRVYSDAHSASPQNRYHWRGYVSSDYCVDCLTDVSACLPDYDYAVRTYGYR